MIRKLIVWTAFVLLLAAAVQAQPWTTEEVLALMDARSPYILARQRETEARKLAVTTTNRLENPEIEYAYMPGIRQTVDNRQSYGVSQAFDWPGRYAAQSRYNKLDIRQADTDYAAARQEILLRTKLDLYELVRAMKVDRLAQERLAIAQRLYDSTERLYQVHEATALDVTNASLNLRQAAAAREEAAREVSVFAFRIRMLTALDDFDPSNIDYAEDLTRDVLEQVNAAETADPEVRSARLEMEKTSRNIAVQRGETLPKFRLGVAGERVTPHESFLGLSAGISVPLWGGKNRVKTAQAEERASHYRYETVKRDVVAGKMELAQRVNQLRNQFDYDRVAEARQARELLGRNMETRHISVIEYLMSLEFYNRVEQEFYDLEFELYSAMAELTKSEL